MVSPFSYLPDARGVTPSALARTTPTISLLGSRKCQKYFTYRFERVAGKEKPPAIIISAGGLRDN